MQSFTCITASGTKYHISFTQTQDIVVRWDDPKGNPQIKGSGTKVWEFCTILGIEADIANNKWLVAADYLKKNGLIITEAQDRYLPEVRGRITWHTTPIVSIVRADGKVLI